LRSFTLFDFSPSGHVLDFVLAHSDTIEELDLDYNGVVTFGYVFDEAYWMRLQTCPFPYLRSLRGHSAMLTLLAYARLSCLRTTLRRLAVGANQMEAMFEAVLSPKIGNGPAVGHLLALQEIELDLDHLGKNKWNKIVDIFQWCARCCPSLEIWRGTLPRSFKIDAKLLGGLFGLFESLRVIYLCEVNILGPQSQRSGDAPENKPENEVGRAKGTEEKMVEETATKDDTCDDSIIEAYLQTIALSCGALQNVSVRRSYPLKDWWTISRTRDPAGESVCSLNRRTTEERDQERLWTSR
jgi:hypothetical protein